MGEFVNLRQMLKFYGLVFVVIAGMLFAPPAHAQVEPASGSAATATVTVTGRVFLDNVGEPNVIVELWVLEPHPGLESTIVRATAITDSTGRYTLSYTPEVPASQSNPLCFSVIPRKSIFEFTPTGVGECIVRETFMVRNFTMLRYPILIVGGITPFSLPQAGCPQLRLNGSAYGPGACGEVEFANVLTALRSAGWQVHTMMLNSSIQGTPALATQTSALRRAIRALTAASGNSKVIVLGHGIGGIVARRYIESNEYERNVEDLFTFGSPHTGNSLEDTIDVWFDALLPAFLANRGVPAPLIPLAINAINNSSVDRTDFLCTTSNFAFRINAISTFNTPGMGQAALCETSASGMASFNLSFRPHRSQPYHLIQGTNMRVFTDLNALGRSMSAALPGNDDAVVQTTNATGFTSIDPLDRLLTRDPNMDAVSANHRWYLNTNGAFDSAFAFCILPMFITRTIFSTRCGTLIPAQAMSGMATEGDEAMAPAMTDADLIGQKTLLRSVVVSNTTTVMTQAVQLVESGSATFLASWLTGTVVFTMLDPSGKQITPKNAAGEVQFETEGTRASYTFSTTQPGLYTMLFQAGDLPAGSNTINHFASIDSAYTFSAARNRSWLPPGGVATVLAQFTGPTPIQSPVVKAAIHSKSGVEYATFNNLGNGLFRYAYTTKNTPGYVRMEIVATGMVNGVEIERNDNVSFTVYPDSFRLNGNYSEKVDPLGLTINAGISVSPGVSGTFRVTGVLVDSSGQQVATATTTASTVESFAVADAGASGATLSVPLSFDGKTLHTAGKNGPFTLARILVVDEHEHAQVSADETNVFTTSAIDVSRFAAAVFVPILTR